MALHPLHTIDAIRDIEQTSYASLPAFTLMQRAGAAIADYAIALTKQTGQPPTVLILVGPGNNGGDALEAASLLLQRNCKVFALLASSPEVLPADAAIAWQHAQANGVIVLDMSDLVTLTQTSWDLVIDGLFGIGLARPITGTLAKLIHIVNRCTCPILALDVPSGLNADTGNVVGAENGCAIVATHTLTFIADKPGLHTAHGRDHSGQVKVATLDIDLNHAQSAHMHLNAVADFAHCLQIRRHNTHKGSYGDTAILGGAAGMSGALILATRTAAMLGSGRVFAAAIDHSNSFDVQYPEIMWRQATNLDYSGKILVLGPGLGTSDASCAALLHALTSGDAPIVIDADALNILATKPDLHKQLQHHRAKILTPHPLEAARLLRCSTKEIQDDRINAARTLAAETNAIVILKGSGSVIARPDGQISINPTGNPALATAGTGDVLSGVCGALLAQGWPAWETALAATWMHGTAADQLVTRGIGPIGLLASECIPEIRAIFNQLITQYKDGKSSLSPSATATPDDPLIS